MTSTDYRLDQVDFRPNGILHRLHLSGADHDLLITIHEWPLPDLPPLRAGQPLVMFDPADQARVEVERIPR